ncbi:MAG: hypothetical protein LLG42_05240 [Chloroflexi bacterium]|nr:hypothetical protein [Chloroflexota bacterium]
MEIHIQIPLNAQVSCLDGECGQSQELIIDPKDQRVTHLVVKERTKEQIERLVPIGMISGTGENTISLCCNKDDLSGFEIFCERDVVMRHMDNVVHGEKGTYYSYPVTRQIVIENKSIPKGKLSFDQNTYIEASDGRVGKLERMLIDPNTTSITHFVVNEGSLLGPREVNVPVTAIDHFTSDAIFLNLSKKEIRELRHVHSLP